MNYKIIVATLILSAISMTESQHSSEKMFPVLPTECNVANYDSSVCDYDNLLAHPGDPRKYLQCGSGTFSQTFLRIFNSLTNKTGLKPVPWIVLSCALYLLFSGLK